jgi:hypothetical protein
MYDYSDGFYIRPEFVPKPEVLPSGFDINTISVITSVLKFWGFEVLLILVLRMVMKIGLL